MLPFGIDLNRTIGATTKPSESSRERQIRLENLSVEKRRRVTRLESGGKTINYESMLNGSQWRLNRAFKKYEIQFLRLD